MALAKHVVPIGERLVALSREITDDCNEAYLIAHKGLRRLLRTSADLSNVQPADLRAAVTLAAAALGVDADGQGGGINADELIGPNSADLMH